MVVVHVVGKELILIIEDNNKVVFNKNDFEKIFNANDNSVDKQYLINHIKLFADGYMALHKVVKGLKDFFDRRPYGQIRLDLNWY